MTSSSSAAALLVVPGPRAAETVLFEALAAATAEAAANPEVLALPIRVVVPSRSLQVHLEAALLAASGRAVAGIRFQTHMGLARDILVRAGHPPPPLGLLLHLLARRFARRGSVLRDALDGLEDGFGAVVAPVRDLLDAGLHHEHGAILGDLLADMGTGATPWRSRAAAVVEVAAACDGVLTAVGGGRLEAALAEAATLLAEHGTDVLPARELWIYGFAETTGVAGDLLEALVRHCGARVVLDQPPDPGNSGGPAPGAGFTARLRNRLEGIVTPVMVAVGADPPPVVELLAAPGPDAEVREVATRIAALLSGGVEPESVAVVARSLDPYGAVIRRHFQRLGVPFSGIAAASPPTPFQRRLEALLEVLDQGRASPVGAWLEVMERLPGNATAGVPWELDVGLRALGAGTVAEVAALPAAVLEASAGVPLPVRRILGSGGVREGEEDPEERLQRHRLPASHLRAAVAAATRLLGVLDGWPETGVLTDHLARLRQTLHSLGVRDGDPLADQVAAMAEGIEGELPGDFSVTRGELAHMVREASRQAARPPIGGRGGGVRVLEVTEYRGCTSDHLFLLGLNRDVFPRVIVEDPLLPDAVRAALRPVLPDLAVKAEGHEEERYLFAQALASSPRVVVSWQDLDAEGNARPISPLVERLRLERGLPSTQAPPWPPPPGATLTLTAAEAATHTGLYCDRERWRDLLTAAVEEIEEVLGEVPGPADIAAARWRVLEEWEPDRRSAAGARLLECLGPYFGFVGTGATAGRPVYITLLEDVAECAWRAFLVRRLGVEPPPESGGVPGVDALLLGRTVHGVLERLVKQVREAAAGAQAEPVPWPSEEALQALVAAEAQRQAREAGVETMAGVLAMVVGPYLDMARGLEWQGEPPRVVGAEVEGSVPVDPGDGRAREVRFRADRLDAGPAGKRFTDYKTGRPFTEVISAAALRRHLLEGIRTGQRLQAAAYAAAGGEGRYVFLGGLRREWPTRVFSVPRDDAEALALFTAAAGTSLAAWEHGGLIPRLVDGRDREPAACSHCPVSEACLRGDSSARARFLAWARRQRLSARGEDSPAENAAHSLWALQERPANDTDTEGT